MGFDKNWKKERLRENRNQPLKKISWEAANAYVKWLGKETDCSFTLPSSVEWAAAVVYSYSLPRDPGLYGLGRDGLRRGIPDEWSRDACDTSFRKRWILGISRQESPRSAKAECHSDTRLLNEVGLRLVYHDD
uniref:Sulfatase-modifying factor enzyme 1 n=1 Tax=Candidatus Kentrum sp. MB TaxID=2138164 RepID=A0A451BEG9_9GAMM|nr:MAG: Sulfatase-modifying factor enzyme 1 [Candidatus Kentron sp. MB]VFK76677.1 MAG: Sulfatase-modifying factor enzyme 1 [Candidatus Kentron sp. MB]